MPRKFKRPTVGHVLQTIAGFFIGSAMMCLMLMTPAIILWVHSLNRPWWPEATAIALTVNAVAFIVYLAKEWQHA